MYDAVFFVILVSLSGVVLIPALQSDVAIEGSVDKHREHLADEALNTLLVSRADLFSYKVGGDIIDDVAGSLGIDNSSGGLYGSVLGWLLAREQLHKTYANLVAENLGCQFKLPFSAFGTNRFNIFTGDFDRQLKKEIKDFLIAYLGDKYNFNFTAMWHPVKGVQLGGDIYIGDVSPYKDCYVSRSHIMMPYKPTITIDGQQINFTRYWLEENVLKSIPESANIIEIINSYKAGIPPYDNRDNATKAIGENISHLVYGFLVDGITDSSNNTLFPGIVNATVSYGFDKTKNAVMSFTEDAMDSVMGDALGSVDDLFENLGGIADPISNAIKDELSNLLSDFIAIPFGTLEEGFEILEDTIKTEVKNIIDGFIDPYIQNLIDYIFNQIDVIDIYDLLSEWLFDRISINKAEVTLTVWKVRG
jgi:hypothetical protein